MTKTNKPTSQSLHHGGAERDPARLHTWQVALTSEEFEAIKQEAVAAGLSVSRYGRAIMLARVLTGPTKSEQAARAVGAIEKLGHALDQLTQVIKSKPGHQGGNALSEAREQLQLLRQLIEGHR